MYYRKLTMWATVVVTAMAAPTTAIQCTSGRITLPELHWIVTECCQRVDDHKYTHTQTSTRHKPMR